MDEKQTSTVGVDMRDPNILDVLCGHADAIIWRNHQVKATVKERTEASSFFRRLASYALPMTMDPRGVTFYFVGNTPGDVTAKLLDGQLSTSLHKAIEIGATLPMVSISFDVYGAHIKFSNPSTPSGDLMVTTGTMKVYIVGQMSDGVDDNTMTLLDFMSTTDILTPEEDRGDDTVAETPSAIAPASEEVVLRSAVIAHA